MYAIRSYYPSTTDLAFTNANRRNHLPFRTAIVGRKDAEFRDGLAQIAMGEPSRGFILPARVSNPSRPIFLFSGHGGQWQGMGQKLLETERVYRTAFEKCCAALEAHLDGKKFARVVSRITSYNVCYTKLLRPPPT